MAKVVAALRNAKEPSSDITGALLEVYGYTHNQNSCECAARVPGSEVERLLQLSGTPFVRRLKRFGETPQHDEVILWVNVATS